MTTLTRVITSHNLKEIERLIFDFPTLILEKENGWLPIEWAEKTGNVVTFTRTARVINYEISSNSAEKWLTKYLSLVTATEYESLPKGKETEMIWESVFEGALFKVDRWQRLLIDTPEQVADIRYLINKSGISNVENLRVLMKNA